MKITKILAMLTALLAVVLGVVSVLKERKNDKEFVVYVGAIALAALLFLIITIVSLKDSKKDALNVVPVGVSVLVSLTFTKYCAGAISGLENASTAFYLILVAALFACIVLMNKYKGCAVAAVVISGLFIYNPFITIAQLADAHQKFVVMGVAAFVLTYVSFMLSFATALLADKPVEEIAE